MTTPRSACCEGIIGLVLLRPLGHRDGRPGNAGRRDQPALQSNTDRPFDTVECTDAPDDRISAGHQRILETLDRPIPRTPLEAPRRYVEKHAACVKNLTLHQPAEDHDHHEDAENPRSLPPVAKAAKYRTLAANTHCLRVESHHNSRSTLHAGYASSLIFGLA